MISNQGVMLRGRGRGRCIGTLKCWLECMHERECKGCMSSIEVLMSSIEVLMRSIEVLAVRLLGRAVIFSGLL